MTLKTYRIVDLIMLGIIGILGEAFGAYIANVWIPFNTPYCVVGIIVVIVAITRWRWYGLSLIPFMALSNYIAGKYFLHNVNSRDAYTVFRLFYTMISYLSVLLCLKFYQKKKPISVFKNIGSNIALVSAVTAIQWVVLSIGNILEVELIYSADESVILARFFQILNVGLGIILSYVLAIVFGRIFASQNVLIDVKQNLIDQRKEKEMEREYYSNLIKPIDETQSSENDSSNRKDCDRDGS